MHTPHSSREPRQVSSSSQMSKSRSSTIPPHPGGVQDVAVAIASPSGMSSHPQSAVAPGHCTPHIRPIHPHIRPRRRKCRLDPHRPSTRHRTPRERPADCRRNRSLPQECQNSHSRRRRLSLHTPHIRPTRCRCSRTLPWECPSNHSRTPHQDRCKCRTHRIDRHSRRCRRKPRPCPSPSCTSRHTRQAHPTGCCRSRNRRRECRRIRTQTPHRDRCTRHTRRIPRRNRPRRRTLRRHPRLPCNRLRTPQGHPIGCRHNRNLL